MAVKQRKTLEKELREALTNNVNVRGLDNAIFTERIKDYIFFWGLLNDLAADIKNNGVTTYDHKSGEEVPRKSVSEAIKASREMGKIFQELDFTGMAKQAQTPMDDDDDL